MQLLRLCCILIFTLLSGTKSSEDSMFLDHSQKAEQILDPMILGQKKINDLIWADWCWPSFQPRDPKNMLDWGIVLVYVWNKPIKALDAISLVVYQTSVLQSSCWNECAAESPQAVYFYRENLTWIQRISFPNLMLNVLSAEKRWTVNNDVGSSAEQRIKWSGEDDTPDP